MYHFGTHTDGAPPTPRRKPSSQTELHPPPRVDAPDQLGRTILHTFESEMETIREELLWMSTKVRDHAPQWRKGEHGHGEILPAIWEGAARS